MEQLFLQLEVFNALLWGYGGVFCIAVFGILLSIQSKWMQIRKFKDTALLFWETLLQATRPKSAVVDTSRGTSPLKAFFASVGGCIGIGNLVTISIAIKIGGPGALVWIWLVAFLAMILKYAEIYLGIKFRIPNGKNSYNGGPMYFLGKAFPKFPALPFIMAFFLCIYGVEIFVFSVIKDTLVHNWSLPPLAVMVGLIGLIVLGLSGGVRRMGTISGLLIPLFVSIFCFMTTWILIENITQIPAMFGLIFRSAFSGHAAVGGFVGSTFLIVLAKGFSAAAYSGDVGIGYASIIQSEARAKSPQDQAGLSIFGIFVDTFIVCTATVLLVVVTGVWKEPIGGEMMVQMALSQYFPYMEYFMPLFLFTLGYTTILPYFFAGMKAAQFMSPTYGGRIYACYGFIAFVVFSFYDNRFALTIMNIAGGMLMLINIPALYKLRHHIVFSVPKN